MMKQILVPLDGSSLAEAVLPEAAALARATSSALTLVRVVPPLALIEPVGGMINRGDAFWEAYQHEPEVARRYLAGIASGIASDLPSDGFPVYTKVMEGDPATCILEYTSENIKVSYIAMSTHGRSGLGLLFFGSVAERIMHSAPVPVLLLRSREEHSNKTTLSDLGHMYRNILVPLDGSELPEGAIEQAQMLAARTGAGLTLLSVVAGPSALELSNPSLLPLWVDAEQDEKINQMNSYLSQLAQKLRDDGLKVNAEVKPGFAADEIIAASDQADVDLIVMFTHGRGGLQRLWLGSVAMRVVHGASRPVLLVRADKHHMETGASIGETREAVGHSAS